MSIKVVNPGILASIQDLGRYGFQKYGVIVSGAMDSFSLRISNLLVGNCEGEAAIEVTMVGTSFQFKKDAIIAITGGDLTPVIDGKDVPLWRPVEVKKGKNLQFTSCRSGCYAYLAISGGYDIPNVMNSQSTYLRGVIGGYKGRALQANDLILFKNNEQATNELVTYFRNKQNDKSFNSVDWYVPAAQVLNKQEIRVIKGVEFERFSPDSKMKFFNTGYKITPQSDRMGYRLSGPKLQLDKPFDLLSEAVAQGTIQVPHDGNPIILLADRQTTGGYPRIAQIATVDLPAIAQLKPGEIVRFKEITLEEAEQLYLAQEQNIEDIKNSILLKQRSL